MTLDEQTANEAEPRSALQDPQRRGRLIIGALSLLVGSAYTWQAFLMPQGTANQPGAGLWPSVVGVAWIVISIIVIIEAAVSTQVGGDVDLPTGRQRRDVIGFYVMTALFAVAIPILGIYLASAAYTIGLIKLTSSLSWWRSTLSGAIIGVAIPALFIVVLQIPLPLGFLGAIF
ncbi:tripartite tricarboxylate transporter TctB family protein [Microbacterium sp. NPDC078428]|uniref:tripartite tricarboxylate transporter TctB family protein n=1 Tax=Microbacterium sp. NPDC078428 TaxID=3364190 RepID=UPI0037CA7077